MTAYEFKSLLDRRANGEKLTRSEAGRLAAETRKVEKRIARSGGALYNLCADQALRRS